MGLSRPYAGEPAVRREVPMARKFDSVPASISAVCVPWTIPRNELLRCFDQPSEQWVILQVLVRREI